MARTTTSPPPPGPPAEQQSPTESYGTVDLYTPTADLVAQYGLPTVYLSAALVRAGLVYAHPTSDLRPADSTLGYTHGRPDDTPRDALLFFSDPRTWTRPVDRPAFGFASYPADPPPYGWRTGLLNVREVWTPSPFLVSSLRMIRSGPDGEANEDVHVIPFGVDTNEFAYKPRKRGERLRFVHYSMNPDETRVGAMLAMRAFSAAFPADRYDVELVVASPRQHSLVTQRTDARVSFLSVPPIASAVAELFGECDALLYPSRGEAFPTIPLEAMACGLPAIFPYSSSMRDIADLGVTFETFRSPATVGYGKPGAEVEQQGRWWEPDFDDVVRVLRMVDEGYDGVQEQVAKSARTIASDWTWERTAALIVARLRANGIAPALALDTAGA